MRKITREIITAFLNGYSRTIDNTSTYDGKILLQGNTIVRRINGVTFWTLAGWPTAVTRERINGLASTLNCAGVHQHNHLQWCDGLEINPDAWYAMRPYGEFWRAYSPQPSKHDLLQLCRGTTLYHRSQKNADGTPMRCRVNGQMQWLKSAPDDWKLPIKHGLKGFGYITPDNVDSWLIHEENPNR